jgi:hypothetical protein
MATDETLSTKTITAKELLKKLGIKGELVSFSVPAKGQVKDSKKDLKLKIVTRKSGDFKIG